MAVSPRFIERDTPAGRVIIGIRYVRPFTQRVPVQFCWLYKAGIEHSCDECGCWPGGTP